MESVTGSLHMLSAYGEAFPTLSQLITNLPVLALLRSALQSGLLMQARQPVTTTHLADTLQLDEHHTTTLCLALDSHSILKRENGYYQLEEHWMTLTDPNLPFPLIDTINNIFAQAHVIEQVIVHKGNYWQLPSAMRLALAKGISINPLSTHSPILLSMLIEQTAADLHTLLLQGARYLELGCGVAGGLLSMLQAYPNLVAVGVDLAEDLLEEAQQRASILGVTNRVQLLHCDVRLLTEDGTFDLVFWSQFFFPKESRLDALRVAMQALKPGGFFMAPLLEEPLTIGDDVRSEQGRQFTLNRLTYGHWGIPAVGAAELQAEVEGAGFINVRLVHTALNRVILAQRGR